MFTVFYCRVENLTLKFPVCTPFFACVCTSDSLVSSSFFAQLDKRTSSQHIKRLSLAIQLTHTIATIKTSNITTNTAILRFFITVFLLGQTDSLLLLRLSFRTLVREERVSSISNEIWMKIDFYSNKPDFQLFFSIRSPSFYQLRR